MRARYSPDGPLRPHHRDAGAEVVAQLRHAAGQPQGDEVPRVGVRVAVVEDQPGPGLGSEGDGEVEVEEGVLQLGEGLVGDRGLTKAGHEAGDIQQSGGRVLRGCTATGHIADVESAILRLNLGYDEFTLEFNGNGTIYRYKNKCGTS